MIIINKLVLYFLVFLFLNACSPANMLATGSGSAMVIAEGERSMGSVIDDATIKVNIAAKFISSQDNLFVDVSTTVLDGRVLLTGLVDSQEIRIDAVRRVWEVEGIQEVINEIQVGNRASLKEYANDVWINTQARGLAAKAVGLRVVGYNFETIKGKVYIAGITSKPEQLEDLINAVKTIKGVKEIVNYVIVKEK
ncbi:BON domain-containing protein [Pelagibacteraceae bacterium]|nr:BON domain-containing protein [Pelagibacteraceae bacterium]